MNRNQELIKSTMILAIGQIVPKLLALIILPLLTGYLSQVEYGLYELMLSVSSFCVPLLSLQIQQGVFRYLIDSQNEKEQYISSSFIFLIAVFAFAFWGFLWGGKYYYGNYKLAILFFMCCFSEVLLTWEGQVVRGEGRNDRYSLAYIIYSVSYVGCLLLFKKLYQQLKIEYVLISMIIAYAAALLYLLFAANIYQMISRKNFNRRTLKKLLKYSSPMVISSATLWVVNLSNRLFVSAFLGLEAMASYAVANKIPNLFNSIYGIFNLAWTENASKLSDQEKKDGYYTIFFKQFYSVMVGMMLILISITPILFEILIADQYDNAYGLMAWLYVGVFFSSLVAFFGGIYVGEKKTKDVGISSSIGAIISVVFNVLYMPKMGLMAAVFSVIISQLIICLYRAMDIKHYVSISYDKSSIIYGIFFIILAAYLNSNRSTFTIGIVFLIALIYNYMFNKIFLSRLLKLLFNKINN